MEPKEGGQGPDRPLPTLLQLLPAAEAVPVVPGARRWAGEARGAPQRWHLLLPRRDG